MEPSQTTRPFILSARPGKVPGRLSDSRAGGYRKRGLNRGGVDTEQQPSPLHHSIHPVFTHPCTSRPRVNQCGWHEFPLPSIPLGEYQSVLGPGCLPAPARLLRTRPGKSGPSPKPNSLHRAALHARGDSWGERSGNPGRGKRGTWGLWTSIQCWQLGDGEGDALPHLLVPGPKAGVRFCSASPVAAQHDPPSPTLPRGSEAPSSFRVHSHPGKTTGQAASLQPLDRITSKSKDRTV